ncbi:MAG TPA: ubiquinone biosynthesis protein UbiB, partial [Novosphingobium sp.]
IRDELGPEAAIADRLREVGQTVLGLPDLVRRIEERFPARGGAPEPPPLPDIELVWERRQRAGNHGRASWTGYLLAGISGGLLTWIAMLQGWLR